MTKTRWQKLLHDLTIDSGMGKLTPVRVKALDTFERKRRVKLPRSYRTYCEVFGAGEFGREFQIAVPRRKGLLTAYSLDELDVGAHNIDYHEYAKDPAEYERGIVFATDIANSYHFFDPSEVTDRNHHEYAVYTLFRDYKVQRMAENFWEFVTDCCLGKKRRKLISGSHATSLFMPADL
jgi:hypothetical protein